jgi:hypothetical protein
MEARRPAGSVLPAGEIGDDQATAGPEYPGDFGETPTFEGSQQMVQHQG